MTAQVAHARAYCILRLHTNNPEQSESLYSAAFRCKSGEELAPDFGPLLDRNLDGVSRLSIQRQNEVHFSLPNQTAV